MWDDNNYFFKYRTRWYQNTLFNHKTEPGLGTDKYFKDNLGQTIAVWPSFIGEYGHTGVVFAKLWSHCLDDYQSMTGYMPHKYDTEDWMLIYLNDSGLDARGNRHVLMSTKNSWINPMFIPWNAKMIVTGTAQITDRRTDPVPLDNYEAKDDKAKAADLYIPMSVKIGQ